MGLEIHKIRDLDRDFEFLLNTEFDHVQNVIRTGKFYELEELNLIADYAKSPSSIIDIGANIGNHSIYFAHRFNPQALIPVEPNPLVTSLLRANLGLNWHRSFDLSAVGFGLSDREGVGRSVVATSDNLGGAKLDLDPDGSIPVMRADKLFRDRSFDLIKIDVEGMEFEVLSGMAEILNRSKGIVFLEVLLSNIGKSIEVLRSHGYAYACAYQRYGRCINMLFEKS